MPTPQEALRQEISRCPQPTQPGQLDHVVCTLEVFERTHPAENKNLAARAMAAATPMAGSGGACEDKWQKDIAACGVNHPNDADAYEACVRQAYKDYDNCNPAD